MYRGLKKLRGLSVCARCFDGAWSSTYPPSVRRCFPVVVLGQVMLQCVDRTYLGCEFIDDCAWRCYSLRGGESSE